MEKNDICNTCGRSFATTPNNCSCFAPSPCSCGCQKKACIRKRQPDCEPTAVIPAITVETTDGITNLANCFVHVTKINTTYYVDERHRPMIIWAGPVEVELYNIAENPLGLRNQVCYTTMTGFSRLFEVYFDKQGVGHTMGSEVQ